MNKIFLLILIYWFKFHREQHDSTNSACVNSMKIFCPELNDCRQLPSVNWNMSKVVSSLRSNFESLSRLILQQTWCKFSKRAIKWSFSLWSKYWEKSKMHSHQIWTYYVLPFSRYCNSKLTIFLLLQCCYFAYNETEDLFMEGWREITWKTTNLQLRPFTLLWQQHCRKNFLRVKKQAFLFLNFNWQPSQNFYG